MKTELQLNCDAIDSTPITIDWQEAFGENGDGYIVYEASECQGCNRLVVSSSLGEMEHCDIDHEVEVVVEGETEYQRNQCRSTIYNEGPMMNYWYPVKIENPTEAAKLIANLPLCVVEFEDGRTGLALTGGGMNLSWEICEAFKLLGYWPPLHFCDLPAMSGRGTSEKDRELIAVCMESCRIAEGWAARKRERLGELRWSKYLMGKGIEASITKKVAKSKARAIKGANQLKAKRKKK